ncbi:E3 ubiquitin-protein ligase MARCH6 [Talaromyces islandicus]|uniref:RING-type E3 ubiquitin transferase n=1 Tax=Talaromyces islandicus TaxID=28573 RepID=A0A0U1M4L6_TALIS|nr:E3 ubiquitin-protein ligase MARCH6 [Talaromyces islandicus]
MENEFDQRPLRGPSPFADVMAFSSNTSVKGKGIEDPDTCRICRGEGSAEEPLFYPCKCSGSIKFVHQNCLMEWLSHSQKKYCELCKTPFRFTKLYDPDMPSELPAPVFVKELAVLGLRSLLTWLRFVLVAFVWLGWLPWSMRAIWRALFWLADGRWPSSHPSTSYSNQTNMQAIMNGTTLITQSLAVGNSAGSTSAPAATSEPPNVLSPMTSILNFSNGEPMVFAIAKRVFLGLFSSTTSAPNDSSPNQINATLSTRPRQPSWLSNVTFLNSLTSSPTFNNIVIDTLEGQLITLLVVISFILVFLIREWVVQQQPAVNVAEEERDAVVQLIAEANDRAQEDEADAHDIVPDIPEQRPGDDYDESGSDMGEHPPSDDEWPFNSREPSPDFTAVDSRPILPMRASSSSRPTLPSRNALDDASNIHRTIEETATSSANQSWPGIDTFKELWARGEGNPDRILQIIQEEGREEDLGWVVNAMTKLQGSNIAQSSATPSSSAGGNLREIFDDEESFNINQPGAELSESRTPRTIFEPSNGAHVDTRKLNEPSEHGSGDVGQGTSEPTIENTESSASPPERLEPPSSATNAGSTASLAVNATDFAQANDQTLLDQVLDWFWGDLTPLAEPDIRAQDGDAPVIEEPALEAAFAPVPNRGNDAAGEAAPNPWQEQVAGPANQDANDADVIEEADDFEGILELIGMQGPIFGLLQNGVFSALLISFTIAVGIWLPYLWGKIALVFLTSPIQLFVSVPLTMLSITADVAVDTLIGSVGYVCYWMIIVFKAVLRAVYGLVPILDLIPSGTLFTKTSLTLIHESSQRLNKVLTGFFDFHETDLPMFSVLAHQALRIHEARIAGLFRLIRVGVTFVLYELPVKLISHEHRHELFFNISNTNMTDVIEYLKTGSESLIQHGLSLLGKSDWVNEEIAVAIGSDYDLARWDTTDRTIAILIGYTFASLLGIVYLKINSMFTGVNRGQRIDGVVAEILNQAGGVMKVILIIGIEMIVFPLYCGLLLDLALMPLFENATLASRIEFTMLSPLTSLFIHWFVGTCYMFHFALFVSMCRKIMRDGVLYFIRDPDDPTFHPVRDVLERNIVTQLRKIAFSAMVYGGLVVVCLGGVVWGLSYSFDNVLPIHWSSKVPVLEFPVDLLFYNSIMPLAVRALKPSEVLNGMYNWWFHDEEGRHVGCTWREFLAGKRGNTENPVVTEEDRQAAEEKGERVYFLRDGKFVRAPASDQVRIPKKTNVFLEVTEDNERVDGVADDADGLHGKNNTMFTKVYIPPNFRLRISVFIFTIWMYAAATGMGVTIVPLVVGRKLLSYYFPSFIQINDIYAFSVGLYLLGGVAYLLFYSRSVYSTVTERFLPTISAVQVMTQAVKAVVDATRLVYVAAAFTVLIPSLLALLVELYVLIPIHSYTQAPHPHVIHFIQDWTLGVLYVQMGLRFIQWTPASRLSAALSAITRDGWVRPNASVATRAIILPASIFSTVAVVLPFCLGFAANTTAFSSYAPEVQAKVYRYAYPASLAVCMLIYTAHLFCKQLDVWRASIRDDVYLIGERLHNLGEKKARDVAGAHRRVDTS